MEWLFWVLLAFVIVCALYAFMIAPSFKKNKDVEEMRNIRIAHRGLHDAEKGIPENSIAAFKRAVEYGFGIEFDIHLTKDGQIVVFHDDTVDRMTEGTGKVVDKTLAELRELHLGGTKEKIPTLSEMLAVVDGKVPLLCEFKFDSPTPELFCKSAFAILDAYQGQWIMESFDPRLVAWVRKNHPERGRGQLASPYTDKPFNFVYFLTGGLFFNFLSRPQFIAYNHEYSRRRLGALIELRIFHATCIEWTIHKESRLIANEMEGVGNIFENFIPSGTPNGNK